MADALVAKMLARAVSDSRRLDLLCSCTIRPQFEVMLFTKIAFFSLWRMVMVV